MSSPPTPSSRNAIARWAAQLRFPQLFALLAALFTADLLLPDAIPFVDELALGLLTALFGVWKKRRQERRGPKPDDEQAADPD